jgi:hypothetical protein
MSLRVFPERAPNGDFGGRSFQGNPGAPPGVPGAPPGFWGADDSPAGGAFGAPTILRDTPGRRSNVTVQYSSVVPISTPRQVAETSQLLAGQLAFTYTQKEDRMLSRRGSAGGDKMHPLVTYVYLSQHLVAAPSLGEKATTIFGGTGSPFRNAFAPEELKQAADTSFARGYNDAMQVIEGPGYSNAQVIFLGLPNNEKNTLQEADDRGAGNEGDDNYGEYEMVNLTQLGLSTNTQARQAAATSGATFYGRTLCKHLCVPTHRDITELLVILTSKANLADVLRDTLDRSNSVNDAAESVDVLTPGQQMQLLVATNTFAGWLMSPFLMFATPDPFGVSDVGSSDDVFTVNYLYDLSAHSKDDLGEWDIRGENEDAAKPLSLPAQLAFRFGAQGVPRDRRVDIDAMARDAVGNTGLGATLHGASAENELPPAVVAQLRDSLADNTGNIESKSSETRGKARRKIVKCIYASDDTLEVSATDDVAQYASIDEMPHNLAYHRLVGDRLFADDGSINRFRPSGTVIYRYTTSGGDVEADAVLESAQHGIFNLCVQGHTLSASFTGFASAVRNSNKRTKRLVSFPRDEMFIVVIGRLNLFHLGLHKAHMTEESSANPMMPPEANSFSENWQIEGSPVWEAILNTPAIDHIRYERSTTDEMHRMSPTRLATTKDGYLAADEVILGAWRIGSVIDNAASRMLPPGMATPSAALSQMGVTLTLGIRWVNSYELQERFFRSPYDEMQQHLFDEHSDGKLREACTATENDLGRRLRERAFEFCRAQTSSIDIAKKMHKDDFMAQVEAIPSCRLMREVAKATDSRNLRDSTPIDLHTNVIQVLYEPRPPLPEASEDGTFADGLMFSIDASKTTHLEATIKPTGSKSVGSKSASSKPVSSKSAGSKPASSKSAGSKRGPNDEDEFFVRS